MGTDRGVCGVVVGTGESLDASPAHLKLYRLLDVSSAGEDALPTADYMKGPLNAAAGLCGGDAVWQPLPSSDGQDLV